VGQAMRISLRAFRPALQLTCFSLSIALCVGCAGAVLPSGPHEQVLRPVAPTPATPVAPETMPAPAEIAPAEIVTVSAAPLGSGTLARRSRAVAWTQHVPVAAVRPTPAPLWSADPAAEVEKPCWCEDRFHFTTLRAWFFQSFVPDRSDPTTLGLEFNSAWGWGRFDVTNISYFEVADYPVAVPGRPIGNEFPQPGSATGINDLLTAFLFSRKGVHHGPHHFSAGFAAQLPTATDGTLGSGRWSLGPALEYEYHKGRFFAAFVALNVFSVGSDASRKSVNMFMLKPMITYELGHCWKALYMPYGVSIYWNKKPEDAVYLPLGGGIQRDFRIGRQQMAASLQFFANVLRPAGGVQHDLRFMLEVDF